MIQWILAVLFIPGLKLFEKEKPLNPSYGILHHADPFFKFCSRRMVDVTILEQNWFTSTKTKCTNIPDHIFGNCLHINNMENDVKALKGVCSLSEFHIFCYVLIRRILEIISLFLARWLPLGSLFGFLSSSCTLIWIYLYKKWNLKRLKTIMKAVSKKWLLVLLVFHCSTIVCLSVLVPFAAEQVKGGIIESQLRGIFPGESRFSIGKVFQQNNSCSTVYDLFYFQCLRKTLFDMEKSEILRSVPVSTEERLLLQMKLSQMFVITLIGHFVLYFSIVIIFCILPRIFIIYLKNKFFPRTKEAPIKKKSSLWDRVLLPQDELTLESTIESSNKRKKTKKSRDHLSKGEKYVGISRSTREHKDKGTSTEEKQTNPDSFIASVSKRKKGSHSTDEKQVDASKSLIEHKDKETSKEGQQNNPDSNGKKTKGLQSTDEKQVDPSRSSIVGKDVASNENDHNNPDSSRVSIAKRMKGTISTDEKQVGISRSPITCKDKATLIKQGQNKTDSDKASIGKNWESSYLTEEKQAELLRLFLQRNKNRKPPESKQVNYNSNTAFIEKPGEKQSICNSSKVSLKKTELRKPLPKVGYLRDPEVKKPQKTGNKTSPKKYVNVGTYACLDPESSSDDSDFVFLDH